ncbi:hypothetical protein O1611_g6069 [Lasiodiplodia mahajangana]|uniref:Uncharacterized protein n=1 Tax=Lasiodiplodia mahajangana TaxID=1108764 RepID=A0ACC2JJS1_9PEZI|nr:hypothetical protein O1611_g6069 [Lasiodiplodia mahajangana]
MNSGIDIEKPDGFSYPVYIGLWTNWSQGIALGSTLTLSRDNANLLIGAITFFITIVAVPRDALYHQRQAIIRNSSSAAGTVLTLIDLIWAWRKATKSWLRVLPLLLLTALTAISLAVASLFAARIATGSEVLLTGSGCGMVVPNFAEPSLTEVFTDFIPYLADFLSQGAIYASQCYEGSSSSSLGCGIFVKPYLKPKTINTNAPCPFSTMCQTEDSNLFIDTGLLNSHYDFGINAPENERFLFRTTLACAPLKSEGYTKVYNVSQDRSYTQYFYGRDANNNYTFAASNDVFYELMSATNMSSFMADYSIRLKSAVLYNGTPAELESNFYPIPDILGQNRDVFIVFLSAGGVLFLNQTLDPWYHATKPVPLEFLSGRSHATLYRQDQAASALACASQEQYCMPPLNTKKGCTPLGPSLDARHLIQQSSSNKQISQRMKWLIAIVQNLEPAPFDVLNTLGQQALVSRRTLLQGQQGYLLLDQWKAEVQHWFDISLAARQNAYVITAAGPPSSVHEASIQRPANAEERELCRSQRRWGKDGHQRLEWITNGALQLQRLAHEELGIGEWENCDTSIPITRRLEELATLDLTDPNHPRYLPRQEGIVDLSPRPATVSNWGSSSTLENTEDLGFFLFNISGEPLTVTATPDKDA